MFVLPYKRSLLAEFEKILTQNKLNIKYGNFYFNLVFKKGGGIVDNNARAINCVKYIDLQIMVK